jgi:16S rRNA (guanine527-N7)-methyltransferase
MSGGGGLDRVPSSLGRDLVPQEREQLARFGDLLAARGPHLGLIAPGDSSTVLDRHVLDSLRAARLVRETDAEAYDLGSGAGLPGLVVAIVRPTLEVALVESQRRRVAWLEYAVEKLEMDNVRVMHGRIEDVSSPVDVCFSRAFAPVERAWELAQPVLRDGGRLVYFAGRALDLDRAARLSARVEVVRDEKAALESFGPLVIIAKE